MVGWYGAQNGSACACEKCFSENGAGQKEDKLYRVTLVLPELGRDRDSVVLERTFGVWGRHPVAGPALGPCVDASISAATGVLCDITFGAFWASSLNEVRCWIHCIVVWMNKGAFLLGHAVRKYDQDPALPVHPGDGDFAGCAALALPCWIIRVDVEFAVQRRDRSGSGGAAHRRRIIGGIGTGNA